MSDRREKRTLLLLYTLGIYILIQASWWAYHLIDLQQELYEYKSITLGINYNQIYTAKVWMILGEGSIFIFFLFIGFWWIRKNLSREMRLAKMEQTFLLSVTHELKTPIAAVKLFLETLKSRKLSEEQQKKIIQDALRETNRLRDLSENILLATRLGQKDKSVLDEETNATEIVKNAAHRFSGLFPEFVFVSSIDEECILKSDHQLFTALVTNLVENAIKYSGDSRSIKIVLQKRDDQIYLSIIDLGIGIRPEEKQRIFEKFYRVGNEQTRKTKGTGLGLYIVGNIVKLHKGHITVENNTPQGTNFTITIPTHLQYE
ncbi:MAG: sensor histidine kinase [Flavobacteriales bacterium]